MFRVLSCLEHQHDWRIVALAALICAVGCTATFMLFERVAPAIENRRAQRVIAAGVVGGCTIWLTHFIAMLAYDGGLPIAYRQLPTVVSALVAIVAATLSLKLAAGRSGIRHWLAGPVMGIGIAAMHFIGMAAIDAPAQVTYNMAHVLAAFAIGLVFAVLAMAAPRLSMPRLRIAVGAVLLTLATSATHFIAMEAMTLNPDPSVIVNPQALSPMG